MPPKTSKIKSEEDLPALEGGPDAGVSKKRGREEGKKTKVEEMAAEIEELKTENGQLKQKVST